MANIKPICVSNMSEISIAVSEKRTAIVVKDKEIYENIKGNVKFERRAGKMGKVMTVLGVVELISLGPTISLLLASAFGLGLTTKSKLKNYKVFIDESSEELLLIKIKGSNAITKGDIVVGYEELLE